MCMIAAADGHIIVVVHVHVAAAARVGGGYKHLICQLRIATGAHFLFHPSYMGNNSIRNDRLSSVYVFNRTL